MFASPKYPTGTTHPPHVDLANGQTHTTGLSLPPPARALQRRSRKLAPLRCSTGRILKASTWHKHQVMTGQTAASLRTTSDNHLCEGNLTNCFDLWRSDILIRHTAPGTRPRIVFAESGCWLEKRGLRNNRLQSITVFMTQFQSLPPGFSTTKNSTLITAAKARL